MWMWSSIKASIWGPSNELVDDDSDSSHGDDELHKLLLREEENDFQIIQREGKVTQLHEQYGLIDGELYFLRSLKPKVSRGPLRVGDCVKYCARRKNENQQWNVVELLWASADDENWIEDATTNKQNQYPGDSVRIRNYRDIDNKEHALNDGSRQLAREVAKVIGVKNGVVQVSIQTQDRKETISFNEDKFSLDFTLAPGDFLCLDVKLDGSTLDDLLNLTINGVSPLRIQTDETALITSWWSSMKKGVINRNIYFTPMACILTYAPRANDIVEVAAIECEPNEGNRKCNWRAYKVVPLTAKKNQKPLDIERLLHHPTKENIISRLLENKNGVNIDNDIDLGIIKLGDEKLTKIVIAFSETKNTAYRQYLSAVSFQYPDMKNIPVRLSPDDVRKLPIEISEMQSLEMDIICSAKISYGRTKILCIFEFYQVETKGECKPTKFNIGTNLHFNVSDGCLEHNYTNGNVENGFEHQYTPYGNSVLDDTYNDGNGNLKNVIKGPRNSIRNRNGIDTGRTNFLGKGPGAVVPKRLPEYAVASHLKADAVHLDSAELINRYPLLDEELSIHNYPEKWHILLHLEEVALLNRMRQYEMSGVVLREAGARFLSLDVPGLAEKRPSLMLGDTAIVLIRNQGVSGERCYSNVKYEGVIEEVHSQSVLMVFDESFRRSYIGELVDVAFVLSRTNIKRKHLAAESCFKQLGRKILFPDKLHLLPPQVEFVTNENSVESNCYSKQVLTIPLSKCESSKLNIISYKVFGESSYTKSLPVKAKPLDESFEDAVIDTSTTSSTLSESFSNQSSPKLDDSFSSCSSSSKRRISVAERLFKQNLTTKTKSNNQHFTLPNISLFPYTWNCNNVHKNSCEKGGLEYEFRLDSVFEGNTEKKSSETVSSKTSGKFHSKKSEENALPAYIPRHMKNNKTTLKGATILNWVNPSLNPEQKSAVARILAGEARPLPYIIYGPPGTGKTVTLVESILQIFLLRSDSRILVTTPSNSSADLIVERLHNSKKIHFGDLARLNAMQRLEESVPELVRPYCFSNCDTDVLLKVVRHRIVVATCDTSGGLYKLGLTQGHFTHCMIDEAGETTEPQSMVPIGLLGMGQQNEAQIILAGDPKQLGPVLQSKVAARYGLEESFLERLSKIELYKRDSSRFGDHGCYDPVLCTKLVRNYRSHQDILAVPSALFYDSELIPEAMQEIKNAMLGVEFLPNEKCPLIFHGVRGQNIQESDSPSWFNPAEGLQVAKYLELILRTGISVDDVGIIAPYRKQTQKLRQLLESLDLPKPKIGSVEEFQGQERPVIIVTTVRTLEYSKSTNIEDDVIRGLGFIRSEKRFNVAVTRAMSLLIVIGDPHLLGADPTWRTFIEHCIKMHAYTGCDLPIGLLSDDDS